MFKKNKKKKEIVILCRDLVKRYGKIFAIRDINFSLERGKIYGLVGPNGSGKTTTLECIAGIIKPTNGEVVVFGEDILKSEDYKKEIGFVPHEESFYFKKRVLDYFILHGRLLGMGKKLAYSRARELVTIFSLNENAKINTLSHGMKRLVGLGQALVHSPKILILDEPFSGLDPKTKPKIRNVLRKLKDTTIIVSSHNTDEIEKLCDEVVFLKNGVVVLQETVPSLIKHKKVVSLGFEKIEPKTKLVLIKV